MTFYSWKESFCTRIGTLDDHLKEYVSLLNELHEAVELKWDRVCVGSLLSDFDRYARIHMANEERLLESVGYPNLQQHLKEHEFFISQVHDFQARNDGGETMLGNSARQFLRDWLLNHILVEDQKYGDFLFGRRNVPGDRRRSWSAAPRRSAESLHLAGMPR